MKIVAILHNIRSIHNVGSIFRTADAAGLCHADPLRPRNEARVATATQTGVEKIYLCGITTKPIDRFGEPRSQLTKVSLGAEKTVPWEYSRRTADVIRKLREDGYKIFAVEQDKKSIPYYRSAVGGRVSRRRQGFGGQEKVALIFGNEVRGITPSILKLADKILEIPMHGRMVRQVHHSRNRKNGCGKESLNVSVAFGVVVFGLRDFPQK